MDLIAKLDLEKAQLQRLRDSSPSSIAAIGKSVSPGKSLYKAFGQGKDSTVVAELQSQLELEKAQRQQVQCLICKAACIAQLKMHASACLSEMLYCIGLELLGLLTAVNLSAKGGLYMADSNAGFCRQSVISMIWWNQWKQCSSALACLKGPDQINQLLHCTEQLLQCNSCL